MGVVIILICHLNYAVIPNWRRKGPLRWPLTNWLGGSLLDMQMAFPCSDPSLGLLDLSVSLLHFWRTLQYFKTGNQLHCVSGFAPSQSWNIPQEHLSSWQAKPCFVFPNAGEKHPKTQLKEKKIKPNTSSLKEIKPLSVSLYIIKVQGRAQTPFLVFRFAIHI